MRISLLTRAAMVGSASATIFWFAGVSGPHLAMRSPAVYAHARPNYVPQFINPTSSPIKLSVHAKVSVALTQNHRLVRVSGPKVTVVPSTFCAENTLTINGRHPGVPVTVTAQNGVANFTVSAVYRTGPIQLTATWLSPEGSRNPVSTFVTVGKGGAPKIWRFTGRTRFGTANQVARASYPRGTETAIVASGLNTNLVDALTAAPLAALLKAPILLTASNTAVGADTLKTLKELKVSRVVLIGVVDNPSVRSQLRGLSVIAYRGDNRYATALKVATAVRRDGGNATTLFFSSGANQHLTDALTVDPAAAALRTPVLLLPPTGGIPAGYQTLLRSSQNTYVVGAAANYSAKPRHATSLTGYDRFSTANAVNQRFFPHPMGVVVTNADSTHLVDALVAGPWAGDRRFPIVMVSSHVIPGPSYDYLQSITNSVSAIGVAGGIRVVPPLMSNAIAQIMR